MYLCYVPVYKLKWDCKFHLYLVYCQDRRCFQTNQTPLIDESSYSEVFHMSVGHSRKSPVVQLIQYFYSLPGLWSLDFSGNQSWKSYFYQILHWCNATVTFLFAEHCVEFVASVQCRGSLHRSRLVIWIICGIDMTKNLSTSHFIRIYRNYRLGA